MSQDFEPRTGIQFSAILLKALARGAVANMAALWRGRGLSRTFSSGGFSL